MSTSEDPRIVDWRSAVLPCLENPFDFDDALREALEYHTMHPPHELVNAIEGKAPEAGKTTMLKAERATLDSMEQDHRDALMQPFIKRNIPPNTAGEIVDDLILGENPVQLAQ